MPACNKKRSFALASGDPFTDTTDCIIMASLWVWLLPCTLKLKTIAIVEIIPVSIGTKKRRRKSSRVTKKRKNSTQSNEKVNAKKPRIVHPLALRRFLKLFHALVRGEGSGMSSLSTVKERASARLNSAFSLVGFSFSARS